MRLLRALSAALVLISSLSFVIVGEADLARAQDVDEAEDEADSARQQAEKAESLLSEAASQRSGVEDELAATLTRLNELGAELSRVSVHLEDLRQAVAQADADIADINDDLSVQAVDAYVRAVAISAPGALGGTDSAELAMVAAANLEQTIGSDQAEVASLTVKRRDLESLQEEYMEERERVEELQAEVDAETTHLEELLSEADAEVAQAATEARQADQQYRQALDAVDLARARQEERERQADRATSTTTTTTTTTGPVAETTTTTTTTTPEPEPDPTTTTTTTPEPEPVTGGPFSPNVERWRSLVESYFPSDRVDAALTVLSCESNGDPNAYNPYSGASGLFQFLPSTWATVSPRAGFDGADVFDPEANVGTAAWLSDYYESRGSSPWAPWVCKP